MSKLQSHLHGVGTPREQAVGTVKGGCLHWDQNDQDRGCKCKHHPATWYSGQVVFRSISAPSQGAKPLVASLLSINRFPVSVTGLYPWQ